MESLGIYFLLLAAVVAGWVLGRISAPSGKAQKREANDIFADYFVGLNYLLNDEYPYPNFLELNLHKFYIYQLYLH